jgi:hypothetical protein
MSTDAINATDYYNSGRLAKFIGYSFPCNRLATCRQYSRDIKHPSNREGLKDSLGGSGLSFLRLRRLMLLWDRVSGPFAARGAAAPAPRCPLSTNRAVNRN